MTDDTRIRRDNERDATALALLYADEDTDRGFLARQIVRLETEYETQREYADEQYRKMLAAEAELDDVLAKKNELVESGIAAVAEWTEYARNAEAERGKLREALRTLMNEVERGDSPVRIHAAMQRGRALLTDGQEPA